MLGQDEHQKNTKNRTSTNSVSELTNHLEMVKKICHALESLNYNVRDRTLVELTMLAQDEHETDTQNRTSTNSASKQKNPLEMVKNQFRLLNRSILRSELGVRSKLRFWA